MNRLLVLFLFASIVIIISFLLFSGMESTIAEWMQWPGSGLSYSVISFALLAADIVLPIPSSLLMMLNGKFLGVLMGTCLSLASGMVSSLIGFFLGRRTTTFVNKFFSPTDISKGNKFFDHYGTVAISISKAIPILSETISYISGCSGISFKKFAIWSTIGHLLISFAYASIGHFAVMENSSMLAALVIIFIALINWGIQLMTKRHVFNK